MPSCSVFTDYLIRKSEHLDDELLRDVTPIDSLIGFFETGQWKAQDGVNHTFDKMNRVFPNMSTAWQDRTAGSCIGTPCDPDTTKIGFGWTRDSYGLQYKAYDTDLICFDQIFSADRAKEQYAQFIDVLRDATKIINDTRILNELFRFAGKKWVATMSGLVPFTFTETGDLITVTPSALPTSKLVVNMLRSRIEYQRLSGALGKNIVGQDSAIEVLSDTNTIWDLVQGDSLITQNWRYNEFEIGAKEYYKYGWTAKVGNFMLKAHLTPPRFQFTPNGLGLTRVFPYENIAATEGIKGEVNQAYIDAPVQFSAIVHRRGLKMRMRENVSINSMMPFAARGFGGQWQFLMDNLTCGLDVNGNPIAVDNSLRNKGKFHADFEYSTQAQFPEYLEGFLHLRETPCVVGNPGCNVSTAYPTQSYDSANALCP